MKKIVGIVARPSPFYQKKEGYNSRKERKSWVESRLIDSDYGLDYLFDMDGSREYEELTRYNVNSVFKYILNNFGVNTFSIIPPSSSSYSEWRPDDFGMWHKSLELCDGFILQGGSSGYDYEMEVIKYAYEHNIPIFGICMGMQSMGMFLGAELVCIRSLNNPNIGLNHKRNGYGFKHQVDVKRNSQLFQMLQREKIDVNSLHIETIINLAEDYISAYNEGLIEAIEDGSKDFFIGTQWHPEMLHDDNSWLIFSNFTQKVEKNSILKKKLY